MLYKRNYLGETDTSQHTFIRTCLLRGSGLISEEWRAGLDVSTAVTG